MDEVSKHPITDDEKMIRDGEHVIVLAFQGQPCTGKTALATVLAERLRCSTIRLDDILAAISPPDKPENADALVSQGFDIIAQMVKTQVTLGLSVIVDSPLARRSHLKKLLLVLCALDRIASRLKLAPAKLIILECVPRTKYAWQMMFEKHSSSHQNKWYKPQSWPFGPEFSTDYADDITPILPSASKMVVDTTSVLSVDLITAALTNLVVHGAGKKIDFQKWLLAVQQKKLQARKAQDRLDANHPNNSGKGICTTSPHQIRMYLENVSQDQTYNGAICRVCQDLVIHSGSGTTGAYACSECPLAIHKSCAELPDRVMFTPENFPTFLQLKPKATYCFPEEHLCSHCEEQGKEFSYECASCVFECHLKCRLIPTIVQHQAHEHPLYLMLKPIPSVTITYHCVACRGLGKYALYTCGDWCMDYNIHAECTLLPPVAREHVHCGYTHDLELIYKRDEELEDYLCALCFGQMNPDAWYYSCKICELDMHLSCAFKEFV